MLKCFVDDAPFELHDPAAFKFKHTLQNHPSLKLESLCKSIPALPASSLYYSKGSLKTNDDFDRAPKDHPNGLSIEETISNMKTSDSYIMVRRPELSPEFAEFHRELIDDLKVLTSRRGWGTRILNPMLFMFISSPNSVTPFHIDRASNFLMQIQGTKTLTVFKPWDERVVSQEESERRLAYAGNPSWKPEYAHLGEEFHFVPGDALHIPFLAGHHVRNGPEDVSVSLSIFFNHRETADRMRALMFNHVARGPLSRLGLRPFPVAQSDFRDRLKSQTYRVGSRLLKGRQTEE